MILTEEWKSLKILVRVSYVSRGDSDGFYIWYCAMAHAPGGLQRILTIKLRLTRLAAYREFSVHWHRAVAVHRC